MRGLAHIFCYLTRDQCLLVPTESCGCLRPQAIVERT